MLNAHLRVADAMAQGSLMGHDQPYLSTQQILHQIQHRNGREVFAWTSSLVV
jgi:hypothetical protein